MAKDKQEPAKVPEKQAEPTSHDIPTVYFKESVGGLDVAAVVDLAKRLFVEMLARGPLPSQRKYGAADVACQAFDDARAAVEAIKKRVEGL